MDAQQAKIILDKIVGQVFGYQNPLSLEQAMQKFAFDIQLPQQTTDSVNGRPTWAQSLNAKRFIGMEQARGADLAPADKSTMQSLEGILNAWNKINYVTTERQVNSINIAESDNIMNSENVYRSQDIRMSKNIIFSQNMQNCEFLAASQGNSSSAFGIRIEDSLEVSNSFSVSWSSKISNSLFMHDCGDMQDSMFCTNMKGGRFYIANVQFEEAEYRRLRDEVVRWILTN